MSSQTIGSRPDLQGYACIFFCITDFKHNQKAIDYPIAFTPLLHPWDCLAELVLIVAHSVRSSVGQLVTPLPPNRLWITFQHYRNWSPGQKLPGQCQLDFSMSCNQSIWSLQQWGLTIQFWWPTKSSDNSLHYFGGLQKRSSTWPWPFIWWPFREILKMMVCSNYFGVIFFMKN